MGEGHNVCWGGGGEAGEGQVVTKELLRGFWLGEESRRWSTAWLQPVGGGGQEESVSLSTKKTCTPYEVGEGVSCKGMLWAVPDQA